MKVLLDISERGLSRLTGIPLTTLHRLILEHSWNTIGTLLEHSAQCKGLGFSVLDGDCGTLLEHKRNTCGTVRETKKKENAPTTLKENKKERELFPVSNDTPTPPSVRVAKSDEMDYAKFHEWWNTTIAVTHMQKITYMTKKRKDAIRARVNEVGKKKFMETCLRAKLSEVFPQYPVMCSIDWMIKPTNFHKVCDGHYNTQEQNNEFERYEQETSRRD